MKKKKKFNAIAAVQYYINESSKITVTQLSPFSQTNRVNFFYTTKCVWKYFTGIQSYTHTHIQYGYTNTSIRCLKATTAAVLITAASSSTKFFLSFTPILHLLVHTTNILIHTFLFISRTCVLNGVFFFLHAFYSVYSIHNTQNILSIVII